MNDQADNAGQLGLSFQPLAPARRVWTPRELMSTVRSSLEREYGDIWVEGEISNHRPAESGHLYFTLKDEGAQLRVVMFRTQARLLRFKPENGLQVVARGRLTAYEARGELQLAAEYLEPKGAGALQIAFEQLKAKLQAEGLFAMERKRPLPAYPRRIGVITSPRGAAIQDMINILQRRHSGVSLLLFPAQVQGENAALDAMDGMRYFNRARNVEIIVIARGGGSVEDLAAFNHEGLARAIAASDIPVVSAIGHETDFTIADFAADLRAPTPSAAAELVTQSKQAVEESVANLRLRLSRASRYQLMLMRNRLNESAQHGALQRMQDLILRRQQRLDEANHRLLLGWASSTQTQRRRLEVAATRLRHFDLRRILTGMRRQLEAGLVALASAARTSFLRRRAQLQQSEARLRELSPTKILERGYALVFDAAGKLVKSASQVHPGDAITARLARGTITATVKKS